MSSPHNHDLVHTDQNPPRPWSTTRAYVSEPVTWVLAAGAAIVLGIVIAVAYAVLWLLGAILAGIVGLVSWIGRTFGELAEPAARTIADPIRSYIEAQATHLPMSADTIWWTWVGVTLGLFILASVGASGARVGWAAMGIASTAMVWAGSAPDGRNLAAGIALATWSVLSVAAFNRFAVQSDEPKVVVIEPAAPEARTEGEEAAAAVLTPPWLGRV
ncbi:MAG: hypothetical protein ACRDTM_10715 [Micromonosporaceae bacterium]